MPHAVPRNLLPPPRKPEKGPPYAEDPDMKEHRRIWWGDTAEELSDAQTRENLR